MENMDFKNIVEQMKKHGMSSCEPISLHVPDAAQMLRSAMEYFIGGDFVWLPEYEQVADWLTDNRGRGLCLYGANGTGKTVLIQKAIPILLFRFCRRVVKCFNYYELNTHAENITGFRLLSIDDVGLENEAAIYGNKRWIFPEIMDIAEKRNGAVIFSSNLDGQGFCEKYGIRTFERIVATTKRVEFNHQSLRK
jgi:DNA replication protein DnaC